MLSVLLDTYLWVESPGHNGTMFNFLRNAKLFYKVVAPFCVLDSNVRRLLTSPHANQHLLSSVFWTCTCHSRYEEVYQCGIFFFPLEKFYWKKLYEEILGLTTRKALFPSKFEHLFMCLLVIPVSFLEKGLFKSFSYYKNGVIYLLFVVVVKYILDTRTLLHI